MQEENFGECYNFSVLLLVNLSKLVSVQLLLLKKIVLTKKNEIKNGDTL